MRVAGGATLLLGAAILLSGCHVDMWRQPKVIAYHESDFFADRQGSRPLVPGTVAQETGARSEDPAFYTGLVNGKPIKTIPVKAVKAFASPKDMLLRGKDRYNAYCTPCHSQTGDGNGFITQRGLGYWQKVPASYHTDRLRKIEDGHLYDVIVNGQGIMYGYASRIQDVNDRWAVVAYIRALQLAKSGAPGVSAPTPSVEPAVESTAPPQVVPSATEGGLMPAPSGPPGPGGTAEKATPAESGAPGRGN
jgi:mono/diheme cytochrome c family protein